MPPTDSSKRWTRRQLLGAGLVGITALTGTGIALDELVSHGVLPGKQTLEQIEGDCSVSGPSVRFGQLGPTRSGTFHSTARRREVGYTIAWPPGHVPGASLPLIVMLHGFGANHTDALAAMTPAQAVALEVDGRPLPSMAMVTVDGGGGYWNPHPGDDPLAMVVSELIPMCRQLNLGHAPSQIGTMGISMGGYGALLLAEKYPDLIRASAAISPAIWTTYDQARSANSGAFASASDFEWADVVTHARQLSGTAVRVASGVDDPFHPGVVALVNELPKNAVVDISKGCHTGPYFSSQEPASLMFLGQHLQS